ncbi:MAG: ketopantoate reductase family protein [Deltaproteobacteria bacterium]|nr:ketopantoate reductase family protein [Deltaproteobacteria bacterium]
MSSLQRISVIGAGAMGAFYANKFFDMDPGCVSLIAGGERGARLRTDGLFVNGRRCFPSILTPEEIPVPSDVVMVAVKHHHLPGAIHDLRLAVGEETHILSVMNGIESEEKLGTAFGMEKVLYAVAVGIDAVREGNTVTCSKQGKLLFGEADNSVLSPRVSALQDLFRRAGLACETPPDMIRALWWKFMINVGFNQVSAVLGAPYGIFQSSGVARGLAESAMKEVISVAGAARVRLSQKDIEDFYPFLQAMSPEGKTSMVQDVEAKRKTEVEMFAGKVVELGRRYRLPTPVNEILLGFIKVIEERDQWPRRS